MRKPAKRQRLACSLGLVLWATVLLTGCASEVSVRTPLPTNMNVRAPAPDTAEPVASFSGIWAGRWTDYVGRLAAGSAPVDHTLVIERIQPLADGAYQAVVIYSHGVGPGHGPASWRTRGTISPDGVLRLVPTKSGALAIYRISPDRRTITGEYQGRDWQGSVGSGVLWRAGRP